MNCQKIQELLSPYLDQVLSQEENAFVEKHLIKCSHCRQELDHLERTMAILHSLPELPLPEGFSSELHGKLVTAQSESRVIPSKGWMKSSYFQWISLSAAAVLMLFLYTFLPPLFMKNQVQSDLAAPSSIQSEEKAAEQNILSDEAEDRDIKALNDGMSDASNEKSNNDLKKKEVKENNTFEEEQTKDTDPNQSLGEVEYSSALRMQTSPQEKGLPLDEKMEAASPEENQIMKEVMPEERALSEEENIEENIIEEEALADEKSLIKANLFVQEDLYSESTLLEIQIKNDVYEQSIERIKGFPEKLPDVLEVAFEKIDGEEKESLIITVVKGSVPQVLTELKAMDMSGTEEDLSTYTTIKFIIKEKIE